MGPPGDSGAPGAPGHIGPQGYDGTYIKTIYFAL